MTLKSFFEPSSVAVVGASREPGKLGHEVIRNIIEAGFRGKLYPINPKADEVLGLKCYPSVKDVPDEIELAVIIVPARFVSSVVADCGAKGVKAAIVISGGFGEVGPAGVELPRRRRAERSTGVPSRFASRAPPFRFRDDHFCHSTKSGGLRQDEFSPDGIKKGKCPGEHFPLTLFLPTAIDDYTSRRWRPCGS